MRTGAQMSASPLAACSMRIGHLPSHRRAFLRHSTVVLATSCKPLLILIMGQCLCSGYVLSSSYMNIDRISPSSLFPSVPCRDAASSGMEKDLQASAPPSYDAIHAASGYDGLSMALQDIPIKWETANDTYRLSLCLEIIRHADRELKREISPEDRVTSMKAMIPALHYVLYQPLPKSRF